MHKTEVILTAVAIASLLCTARARACSGSGGPAEGFARTPPLPGFTFGIDVAMAMRHFPWLHFHVEGVGKYEPGKDYQVHFTKLPWFASAQAHDTDLAMLEPSLWPSRFLYQETGQENGNTLFELQAIDDPLLKNAVVGLGPKWCARQIEADYSDGTRIKMNVNFGRVGGLMLPASLTADIDEPHLDLSASAQFKDYTFAFASARESPAGSK